MKNIINKLSLRFMLTILLTITINFSTMAASAPFEKNNQNSEKNFSGQLFDNSSSNKNMWGHTKSKALFQKSATLPNSGTRMYAPGLPDEPGATCVPVPDGTLVLLGLVFIWGLVVVYKTKREKVKI